MIALLAQVSTGFLFLWCWRDLFCSWSVLNGKFFFFYFVCSLCGEGRRERGSFIGRGGGGGYVWRPRDERGRGICVTFYLWVNNSMLFALSYFTHVYAVAS